MIKKCLFCGEPFTAKRASALYCSTKHRIAYNRKGSQELPVNQSVKPKVIKEQSEHWALNTIEQAVKAHGLDNTKAFFDRQFSRFIDLGR